MSFFDDAYDNMTWEQVCCRLPSDMAVNALQRRVTNLKTLRMFFENVGKQPNSIKAIKEHINTIVANESPDDILTEFVDDFEVVLFNWLDDDNVTRIREHDSDKLSLKFLFNCTDADDRKGLSEILDRVLQDSEFKSSHLRSVLNKADVQHMTHLIDSVVKDARPEVRVCILGISSVTNESLIGDRYKMIGLKALAKCTADKPISSMSILDIKAFSGLKPTERIAALKKYFSYFPLYKKVPAFSPVPDKEEFDAVLFAGCLEHYEDMTKLNETYLNITTLSEPKKKDKNSP